MKIRQQMSKSNIIQYVNKKIYRVNIIFIIIITDSQPNLSFESICNVMIKYMLSVRQNLHIKVQT